MVSFTVLAVGGVKEPHLTAAIGEYTKRLSAFGAVEVKEIREERITDEGNAAAVEAALKAEGEKLLAAVPKGAYKIALCVEGKTVDSPGLAAVIGKAIDERGRICFLIGSSHGLSPDVKRAADLRLSMSALTFPHQLMRLFLFEAIYRSMTILSGKTYHK